MGLTNRQIQLVQESWDKVVPIAPQAAEIFYAKLFELDPALRALFKSDMKEQGAKLMKMIGMCVRSLDNLDVLVPAAQDLGIRHVNYGVTDDHYATVAQALLWTLEQGLGPDFTPELKEAWTATYTTLADIMKSAAGGVSR